LLRFKKGNTQSPSTGFEPVNLGCAKMTNLLFDLSKLEIMHESLQLIKLSVCLLKQALLELLLSKKKLGAAEMNQTVHEPQIRFGKRKFHAHL
jgi:hypothetical protein